MKYYLNNILIGFAGALLAFAAITLLLDFYGFQVYLLAIVVCGIGGCMLQALVNKTQQVFGLGHESMDEYYWAGSSAVVLSWVPALLYNLRVNTWYIACAGVAVFIVNLIMWLLARKNKKNEKK